MPSGYQKVGLLVLAFFLLVIFAEAYSDVDLRIAERKAIPHYIRHSYEYPDIDIKKIMEQRGLLPKPQNYNRPTTQVSQNRANQEQWQWRFRSIPRKHVDLSNHIDTESTYDLYKPRGPRVHGIPYERRFKRIHSKYGGKSKKHRYN